MNGTDNSAKHYDMLVIGSGAIQAAKLGKKVAVVERFKALGGARINTGTIPIKTLREAVLRSTRPGCAEPDLRLRLGEENRGSGVQRSLGV